MRHMENSHVSPKGRRRRPTVLILPLLVCHLLVLSLAGCGNAQDEGQIAASGFIEGDEVLVAAEVGGLVAEVRVSEGDPVEVGQLLIRLDDALLQTQRGEALAAVAAVEANLARVLAGPRTAEIAAARAALAQAVAQRDGAQNAVEHARQALENPQELNAQIVEAETQVALAEQGLELAEAELSKTEFLYEVYDDQGGDTERSWALNVAAARAALDGAQARLDGAHRYLNVLYSTRADSLTLQAELHLAEMQYDIAQAAVEAARAALDELEAGPTAEEIAVAEAQVHQAEGALGLIDAQLAQLAIASPITGTVASRSIHAGETAAPGSTLLTLVNLDEVTLVVYVPENQIGRVRVGQPVVVAVDSFPGRTFVGQVTTIASEAEFTPRNVQTQEERVNLVFAVKVTIPNPNHALKPGMPADAFIRL
jgi:HlyD family secretion protein